MVSTFSSNLRIELIATGEQSGTWGDTTNTNLGTLLEQAITGAIGVAHDDTDTLTLTTNNGASDQARNMTLVVTGTLTADRPVIIPSVDKVYVVRNSTTGGFSITPRTSGGTGPSIGSGETRFVFCDGTNVNLADDFTVPVTRGGTGATTAAGARTALGLGSIATQDASAVALTGGAIDGTTIGGTTPAAGTFSSMTASSATITGGSINGTSIGAATRAAGNFTTITATGDASFSSADVQLFMNDTDGVVGGNISSSIRFQASGTQVGLVGFETNVGAMLVRSQDGVVVYDVPTGENHSVRVNNTEVLTIGSTGLSGAIDGAAADPVIATTNSHGLFSASGTGLGISVAGSQAALVDPAGTSTTDDASVITREKGDSRYVLASAGANGLIAVLQDRKTAGTPGQTPSTSGFNTQELTSILFNKGGNSITLTSNQFTPAVDCVVEASWSRRDTGVVRIYDVTGTAAMTGKNYGIGGGSVVYPSVSESLTAGNTYRLEFSTNNASAIGAASSDYIPIYAEAHFFER
jgi:hypothetical protein